MAALIPALIKLAMSGGFRGRGGGGGGGGASRSGGGGGRSGGGGGQKDPDAISMEYVDKNARKELINPDPPPNFLKLSSEMDEEIDRLKDVLRGLGGY